MAPSRDPEATRTAILEAAEEVFLAKGYGNSALSEIARRAGITKSLIHHHFGSKEGLWREVKMARFEQYARQQTDLLRESGPVAVDLLRESMEVYFRFLQSNQELVRILAWMFLEQDKDECLVQEKELTQIAIDKIRAAQEAGELRADVDPRFIIFTFVGLGQHWFQDRHHYVHDYCYEGDLEELDAAYLDAMIKIFFDGVRAK